MYRKGKGKEFKANSYQEKTLKFNDNEFEDFDFIGDIHGYADSLQLLLRKLGYVKTEQGYKHWYMAAFFRQVKIGVLTLTLEKKQ